MNDHVQSNKHKRAATSASSSKPLTSFFTTQTEGNKLAAAEATFSFHCVKHHHSYNSSSCTSKIISQVFNDSKVGVNFSSAKTKTEAIVNNVISPFIENCTRNTLSNINYVGVCTDASNHKYLKIFPVLVQYFDCNEGVQSRLLNLNECDNETSTTVSECVYKVISDHGISDKISAFGGDNTNTNFGGVARKGENNVFRKLQNKLNRQILGVGCPAHILHNSIQTGADVLSHDIQVIIVKVYNYFSIYTVRVASLKEFCDFVDVTHKDLLRHVKTRWLSLFPAIERFIYMFQALKSYFLSLDTCPSILKQFFSNSVGEMYLHFLHAQMSPFQRAVASIEREDISVNEVRLELENVVHILEERKRCVFVTSKVRELMSDLTQYQKSKFLEEVGLFYQTIIDYLIKWSKPLSDLEHFDWILLKTVPLWESIEKTVKWMHENTTCKLNESLLFDQIVKLKCFLADTKNEIVENMFCDKKWVTFFHDCVSGEQYSELLKIVEYYFSVPGHNANVERVFSLMAAQWTEERNRLTLKSVHAMLQVQYNMKHVSCSEFHKLILNETKFLSSVHGSEKYEWYNNNA